MPISRENVTEDPGVTGKQALVNGAVDRIGALSQEGLANGEAARRLVDTFTALTAQSSKAVQIAAAESIIALFIVATRGLYRLGFTYEEIGQIVASELLGASAVSNPQIKQLLSLIEEFEAAAQQKAAA